LAQKSPRSITSGKENVAAGLGSVKFIKKTAGQFPSLWDKRFQLGLDFK